MPVFEHEQPSLIRLVEGVALDEESGKPYLYGAAGKADGKDLNASGVCDAGHGLASGPSQEPSEPIGPSDPPDPPEPPHERPGLVRTNTNLSRMTEGSLMMRVQRRINVLDSVGSLLRSPSKLSTESATSGEGGPRRGRSFKCIVVSVISAVALVSCGSLFIVLEVFVANFQDRVQESNASSIARLRSLIAELNVNGASAGQARAEAAVSQIAAEADTLEAKLQELVLTARIVALGVCCVLLLCSVWVGRRMGSKVARPLRSISALMQQLGSLDLSDRAQTLNRLRGGHRSRIEDVSKLQTAACNLARGVELFAHYLPETVVKAIIRGDERARRPHVFKRNVTIMFSDIKDFTTTCESLSQEDLLFMLTRYFSIMTRIVESYDGVVAEILGDGLLVFWNTPDEVEDHAGKACVAALAQQAALTPLNAEFASYNIPSIAVRIGLHTGRVLSGVIGSELKMKFGCMGDPINLASRMEGLCKFYGVSILVSNDTLAHAGPHIGIVVRKLDLVQVKGKNKPTEVFEIMGMDVHMGSESSGSMGDADWTLTSVSQHIGSALGASTKALSTFDGLMQNPLFKKVSEAKRKISWVQGVGDSSRTSFSSTSSGQSRNSPLSSRASRNLCESVSLEVRTQAESYESALDAYQQGRFQVARHILEALMEEAPDDTATSILLERVKVHFDAEGNEVVMSEEQRASWTGVRVMFEK